MVRNMQISSLNSTAGRPLATSLVSQPRHTPSQAHDTSYCFTIKQANWASWTKITAECAGLFLLESATMFVGGHLEVV